MRGPGSLGSLVSNLLPNDIGEGLCGAGLPSFEYPSPLAVKTDPAHCQNATRVGADDSGEYKYYSGGYSSQVHEHWDWKSLTGIKFNAVQMELPRCIRFNEDFHVPFADSLTVAMCSFLRDVFGEGTC